MTANTENPNFIPFMQSVAGLDPKTRALIQARTAQTIPQMTDAERIHRGILRNVPCDCFWDIDPDDWCHHMSLSYDLFQEEAR